VRAAPAAVAVCEAAALPPGGMCVTTVLGVEIVLYNLGDRIVAYRNFCPHQGAPICFGRVGGTNLPSAPGEYRFGREGRVLHCPWHGWHFDLETGQAYGHRSRLARVDVAVEDGTVVVRMVDKRKEDVHA
jgi:nitrite reductase (NADH) small subunit